MRVGRMIFHAVAIAALGSMCMAQSNAGTGRGMGQQQQGVGQQQPGMERQNGGIPPSMGSNTMDNSKSPDQTFITKAAQGGLAEVTFGNLAKQNGSSDAVKEFGNRMVTDHSQANDQLRQLAQQKGITLPSHMDAKDKRVNKLLQSKQGAAFDQAYIRDMVEDHEADVAEFRKEATNGKDPEVKAWAQKTLPVLEQHLATAKQVAGQVGGENSKTANSMSSHPQ